MTPICQPLDGAVNKSFHSSYSYEYDLYLSNCLKDPLLKTKKGNIKSPSHEIVSDWVWNWVCSVTEKSIINAFAVCGLNGEEFNSNEFHQPLKTLFIENSNIEFWIENNKNLYNEMLEDQILQIEDELLQFENTEATFYQCLHHLLFNDQIFIEWFKLIVKDVLALVMKKWNFIIQEQEDKENLVRGEITSNAEIIALCEILEIDIILKYFSDIDTAGNEKRFTSENGKKEVVIYKFENFYSVKK